MSAATVNVTDSTFAEAVLSSATPVLVDFWATWCGPCRAIAPKLEELATEMSAEVVVAKVDVDTNQQTAARYGIRSIPTLILFKGGQPVEQVMGNVPKEKLVEMIRKHT
jgi:thioredoxin 1